MSIFKRTTEFIRNNTIWVLLTFGLGIGVLFIFSVPPWMHYDEPGHFEYAWLIANRPGLPSRGDYDQGMRREVSASIVANDLEEHAGMTSDPLETDQPIEIFLPQVEDHPPTYYLLVAIPLAIFRYSDITFQLYLARFVSLFLFLALVWVAYKVSRGIFGEGHPVNWMAPLFLITLPSFVDIMTAVNNDSAANLAFGLFIWASVLLIKKGFSNFRLPKLIGTLALCWLTKSTTLLAFPLSLIVILLALAKNKRVFWGWLALGLGILGLAALSISWEGGAPAYFYSRQIGRSPHREILASAPLGEAVILQEGGDGPFYAMLTPGERASLAGGEATLGAWIWADQPTVLPAPRLQEGEVWIPPLNTTPIEPSEDLLIPGPRDRGSLEPVSVPFSSGQLEIGTEPTFYTFTVSVPPAGGNISWVSFPAASEGDQVYWDGILLVPGDYHDGGSPNFDTIDAETGLWGGQEFTNMVRNGSGEKAWPVFSDLFNTLVNIPNRIVPSLSLILSPLDLEATGIYFQIAGERIFRTFWAVFGWANVALYGQKPYRFFLGVTLVYLIGLLFSLFQKDSRDWVKIRTLFMLTIILQLIVVIFRGVGSWFYETYIPVGRYIYPAIIPVSLLFVNGINHVFKSIAEKTRTRRWVFSILFVSFHISIILWAILSLWMYYSGN